MYLRSLRIVKLCGAAFLLTSCGHAQVDPGGQSNRADDTVWQVAPDVEVRPLVAGVWLHTSFYTYPGNIRVPSNGLLVQNGDSLLIVDSAWGEVLTEQLLDWIEARFDEPLAHAIITHSHYDRIAGTEVLRRRGVRVLAHPLTRQLANEQGLPPPDTLAGIAEPGSVARIGSVEVLYPGAGHAPENLMVWIPEAGVLFGGCAVRAASSSSLGNVAHADVSAWPGAIRRAQQRYGNARLVVPGHGDPGGVELLIHTLSLLSR